MKIKTSTIKEHIKECRKEAKYMDTSQAAGDEVGVKYGKWMNEMADAFEQLLAERESNITQGTKYYREIKHI